MNRFASFTALALLEVFAPSAFAATTIFRSGFETLPCQGLECFQGGCAPGTQTRIAGRVFAPNGTLPLPNVQVFVPNAALAAFPDGVQCARCDVPPSGSPIALTRSGADGSFVLDNAPATVDVPVVIQSGKWRRRVVLGSVAACGTTTIPDGTLRFPKDASEGDLPRIALSTGGADAQECLLRKAGIADTEFTPGGGPGHVQLFAGSGGTDAVGPNGGTALSAASTNLWSTLAQLSGYDLVVLSCEGAQNAQTKPALARQAMKDYADIGGRVMMGHWHNIWLQAGAETWPTLASWQSSLPDLPPTAIDVATGFARGDELAQWVVASGASATSGKLAIQSPQHTAVGADATRVRKRLYKDVTVNGQPTVQYFSFTTPSEDPVDAHCGRVAFSELHASAGDSSNPTLSFPAGCTTSTSQISPEEKAAIYVLFDLTSCVDNAIE